MAEVSGGLALFVCALVWLILGGYSFGKAIASGDVDGKGIGAVMGFCLVLAPFAFGFSLADKRTGRKASEVRNG